MAGHKRHRGGDAWQLVVTLGTDYTGKPKRYTKTFHGTSKQADKELARFYVECEEGRTNAGKTLTVQALADIYVKESAAQNQKRNSLVSINSRLRNWILPYFGKRKVTTITDFDILQWINMMGKKGLAPKTIHNIVSVFKAMLEFAVRYLKIITTNPCQNAELPKKEKKEAKSYTEADSKRILQCLYAVPEEQQALKCFILLAIFGGFRKGELLGFNWDDLDITTNKISVVRTRYRDSEKHTIFEDVPKTEKSVRTVSIPSLVVTELKKLRLLQKKQQLLYGSNYIHTDAMLKNADGSLLNPNKPYHWFSRLCRDNDIPFSGIHTLRHTHASLMVDMGTDYVELSQRMGHAQLSTTMDIYTHLFKNRDEERADQLEQFAEQAIK